MTQFLKDLNPNVNIKYICSFDKKHGLTFEDMSKFSKSEVELIIIPDASMTVKDAIQIKENFNCDILVADHHEFSNEYLDMWTRQWFEESETILNMPKERLRKDCYTNYCTWINSNDGIYPNPSLSGAGVVMKLIEAYEIGRAHV